jgi:glycosyltransferase involved in cell wall biosynthesis
LKVLQISASYKPAFIYGGPVMSVAGLCEQLEKAGSEVTVYTTTANGPVELDIKPHLMTKVDDVPVIYYPRLTKDHTHLSPALLYAVWKTVKTYDVVHIHAWWNLVSVLSCLIAVWKKVPVLVSPRGTLSPYSFQNKNGIIKSAIHHLLTKPLFKRCHIHATSKREEDAVRSLVRFKSITTLYNFVKLPTEQAQAQQRTTQPVRLIFLSRIEEKKGLDILLHALPLLTVPYQLTIAGHGREAYVERLKTLTGDLGIADHICWKGFIQEEKFRLLQQHDLLILPSHDENFGNVVIESLGVGTPVLISEEVGLAAYINDQELGWLCQITPASIAENIIQIAKQSDERNRIRERAPSIIYRDFQADTLVKKYISLYHSISARS